MSNKTKVNKRFVKTQSGNRRLKVSVNFFEDIDRMNEQWKLFEDGFAKRCKSEKLGFISFPHCGLGIQLTGKKKKHENYKLIRKPIICDYMVFKEGTTGFIDCKYTSLTNLKYSEFLIKSTKTQFNNFVNKLHRQTNIVSGFVIGMKRLDSCYFLDSKKLNRAFQNVKIRKGWEKEFIHDEILTKIGTFKDYQVSKIFNA